MTAAQVASDVAPVRLALFVDSVGMADIVPRLAPHVTVCAVVAAGIRPQYLAELGAVAQRLGCPFLVQPRYADPEYPVFVSALAQAAPTRLLVHSYSMILREDVLRMVNYDAFNIHAALLPRNRGPNPIQWALIHDDEASGVTLHRLDDGLDTGAIVAQIAVPIGDEDDWRSLAEKLKRATNQLLDERFESLVSGRLDAAPQDESLACKNDRLTAESPRLDLDAMSDRQIFNWIRAQVAPLKGAYVERANGERLHVPEFVKLDSIPDLRARLRVWLKEER